MSAPINDGGPAFPCQDPQAIHSVALAAVAHITDPGERDQAYTAARAAAVGGMSLRDYFAGLAMQGWLASYAGANSDPVADKVATFCYELADAMLKARAS